MPKVHGCHKRCINSISIAKHIHYFSNNMYLYYQLSNLLSLAIKPEWYIDLDILGFSKGGFGVNFQMVKKKTKNTIFSCGRGINGKQFNKNWLDFLGFWLLVQFTKSLINWMGWHVAFLAVSPYSKQCFSVTDKK